VHVVSGLDEERRSLQCGALGFMHKPVTSENLNAGLSGIRDFVEKRVKQLLVVEDDPIQSQAITDLIGDGDVQTTTVSSGEGALQSLEDKTYDCVVLDLRLPGMSGFELIERIKADPRHRRLPVIVYTGRELTDEDKGRLHGLAQTVIIKDVTTMERLLDETALFLHRVEANLPERKQRVLRRIAKSDPQLAERNVLVVDDDLRNIFALTSLLEGHKMHVQYAENGKRALAKLEENPNIDVVLMDIMMPEMDGYEALRKIRERPQWHVLPVIALTAKAMKGDREKCLEAGASDYITKPVDADQLLSLLRVWLYQACFIAVAIADSSNAPVHRVSITAMLHLTICVSPNGGRKPECDEIAALLEGPEVDVRVYEQPVTYRADSDFWLVLADDFGWHQQSVRASTDPRIDAARFVVLRPSDNNALAIAERERVAAVVEYDGAAAWRTDSRRGLVVRSDIAADLPGELGRAVQSEHYASWWPGPGESLAGQLVTYLRAFIARAPRDLTLVRAEDAKQRGLAAVTIRVDARAAGLIPNLFPADGILVGMSGPPGGIVSIIVANVSDPSAELRETIRASLGSWLGEPTEIGPVDQAQIAGEVRSGLVFYTGAGFGRAGRFGTLVSRSGGTVLVAIGVSARSAAPVVASAIVSNPSIATALASLEIA